MANKTLVPAFRAHVGDWEYYIAVMKYSQVDGQVKFAYELGGNKDLNSMIQRGLSDRTADITEYLLRSESRFLGALIVACWGGNPEYHEVQMEDPEGMLANLDEGFGVLTFDGSQQFFALDGQHRLRAIKDAIKKDPALGAEEVCVLIVSHFESEKGKERTRRLFTNINRNAKTTTAAENIALDEDDGYAILTRRFLTEHPFLSDEGRVKIFTSKNPDTGELRLAGNSVAPTDKLAWSTITVLEDILRRLGHGLNTKMGLRERPTDDVLEESYTVLSKRIDDLLKSCGNVRSKLEAAGSARDVRVPKGKESDGHPFMRPNIQRAVARVISQLIDQDILTWETIMSRLSELDWRLGAGPWLAAYLPEQNRMLTSRDNTDLLDDLLWVHLAPESAQAIKRARRSFKELRGTNYPISEADLSVRLQVQSAS